MTTTTKQFIGSVIALALFVGVPALASEITIPVSSSGQSVVPTLPALPIVSASENQIIVTWQVAPGAEGYRVYRIKDGTTTPELVAEQQGADILSYTDSGLEDGTYFYQIQPFLGSLEPELSNILPAGPVTISIPTSTPAPTSSSGGGGGGGTVSTPPVTPTPLSEAAKKMDTNSDDKIDVLDFNSLMVNWGKEEAANIADFDGNGNVDIFDFNLLMVNWTG